MQCFEDKDVLILVSPLLSLFEISPRIRFLEEERSKIPAIISPTDLQADTQLLSSAAFHAKTTKGLFLSP